MTISPNALVAAAPIAMTNQRTGLGWSLWVVAAALPWMLPFHAEPWTAFYSEALAAAVMLPVAAWTVLRGRVAWQADALAVAVLALSVVPLAQALFGLFVFAGEARLVALYLTAFAAVILVARRAEQVAPLRLVDATFAALAVAALLSVGLALYQWFGQEWMGIMVSSPSVRAYANVGQPNNLATLLCWGLVAVWWGHTRGKIGSASVLLAAAFLLVGVVLTRSRAGWVEVAVIAAAAIHLRRRHQVGPTFSAVLVLAGWFVLLTILEPTFQRLLVEAPASVRSQTSIGSRPIIWEAAIEAIAQRPWFGYGWNQGVLGYLGVADRHPDLHLTVHHAHSLLLDLMIWNGVPIGLAIAFGLALWARAQWRASHAMPQRLLLLALALLLVHAMLELPHAYLYFLVPAAVMMGTLGAMDGSRPVASVPRAGLALATIIFGSLLALAVSDYRAIEEDLRAARMRGAGIHNPHPAPEATPVLLGFLHTALTRLRAEHAQDLSDQEFADMRRALDRYPGYGALFRYARASALRGQPDEARWALDRLCLLNPMSDCESALRRWRELAAQGNPEMHAVTLPVWR